MKRPCTIAVARIVRVFVETSTLEDRNFLERELKLLQLLQPHPNVVSLMGCCTAPPLYVIVEYASNGNLRDLLRAQRSAFELNDLNAAQTQHRHPNLRVRGIYRFALHIASAMDYISSHQVRLDYKIS